MVSAYSRNQLNLSTEPALREATTETLLKYDKDYIYLNDMQINKEQFRYAFGGDMNPGKHSVQLRKFGNPAPAGLCAFGMCCITLGLINMRAKGITDASILIGTCLFSAGLVEFCVACWSILVENTFGATVFFCFAGFWSGFGLVLGNAFGIQSTYNEDQINDALGLYLLLYVFFTFMLWICTLKSTWPFMLLFLSIFLFVLLFDIGYFSGNKNVTKAGGFFCTLSGILGLYNAFAGMADTTNSYFTVQPFFMPGALTPESDLESQLSDAKLA